MREQNNSSTVATDLAKPSFGLASFAASRDEMNLAEFPLAILSTRSNPNIKTLEFSDTQRSKSGELVERKWIITGADKFGLPTATDDDVVLGLICLSMKEGFREPKVYFTRYELLKILRWSTEGRSYSRLTKSLDRLSGVRIRATNAFYDNASKSHQTRNFGIIDAYEINDERGKRGDVESYFIWSETLFDSFKSGFIKKLDLDLYFSLKSAVSRRLYRYLDKHFYYRSVIEKPLQTFAFEKLGLSRTYKFVSSIRQQLDPAAEELIKAGFLSAIEYSGRGEGTVVRFSAGRVDRASGNAEVKTQQSPKVQIISGTESLKQAAAIDLKNRGLRAEQIKRLLEPHTQPDLERVQLIIKYFDELVRNQDWRISRNPIGFLYRAVEKPRDFSLPQNFEKHSDQNQKRPERQIFKKQPEPILKTADQMKSAQIDYKRFVESSSQQMRTKLSEQQIQAIYTLVDAKISCLKGILDQQRYHEAREGCVNDELMKLAGIPDFASWKQAQP